MYNMIAFLFFFDHVFCLFIEYITKLKEAETYINPGEYCRNVVCRNFG